MEEEKRVISWDELLLHSDRKSLWVVIEGQVFDVTTYLAEHPGGDEILLKHGGQDATAKFLEVNHSKYARSLRDTRLVGQLTKDPQPDNYDQKIKSSQLKAGNKTRSISWEELSQHNKKDDLWMVVEGKVYDLTKFQDEHPGGPAILLGRAGDDATSAFHDANHSNNAYRLLEPLQVGIITGQKIQKSQGANSNLIYLAIILILIVGFASFKLFGK